MIGEYEFGWFDIKDKAQLTNLQNDLSSEKIQQRLDKGDRCFVAKKNKVIVAFVWISEKSQEIWEMRSEISLQKRQMCLYNAKVDPKYRGRGILPRAVHYLDNILVKEGFDSLLSVVFPENHLSLRTLRKDGFVEIGYFLYKRQFFWAQKEKIIWGEQENNLSNFKCFSALARFNHFIREEGIKGVLREVREYIWSSNQLLLFERSLRNYKSAGRTIGSFEYGWLKEEDSPQLTELQNDLIPKKIRERLMHGDRCFVTRKRRKIVAFVWVSNKPRLVWELRDVIPLREGQIYRYNAKVKRECRGFGIFLEMVHELENILINEGIKSFLIAIHPNNDVAIRTNKKDGFVQVGYCYYKKYFFFVKKKRVMFGSKLLTYSPQVHCFKPRFSPAIIIGQGRTGLGANRLLGSRGIPIVKVAPEKSSVGKCSRYGDFHSIEVDDTQSLICLIRDIKKKFHTSPVLIPTNDKSVRWISSERNQLENIAKFVIPDEKMIDLFFNKELFSKKVTELGFSTPKTGCIRSEDDLQPFFKEDNFPYVIKPNGSHVVFGQGEKALWIPNKNVLRQKSKEFLDLKASFLIQEAIFGDDSQHWSCGVYIDQKKSVQGVFTARKVRQYPPLLGIASICESIWNEKVAQSSINLLKKLGYVGVAEVEFKKDSRDGEFKLIEVNPRLWIQHPLAAYSGIDFSFLAYLDALEIPFDAKLRQRERARWIAFDLDLLTVRKLFKEKRMDYKTWLSAYRLPLLPGLFQLNDPYPALHRAKEMTTAFLGRRFYDE